MNLFNLIGKTPLVHLQAIPTNPRVKILGKLEGNNPGGSVKDRAAYGMIKGALDRGDIKLNDNLVEATPSYLRILLAWLGWHLWKDDLVSSRQVRVSENKGDDGWPDRKVSL